MIAAFGTTKVIHNIHRRLTSYMIPHFMTTLFIPTTWRHNVMVKIMTSPHSMYIITDIPKDADIHGTHFVDARRDAEAKWTCVFDGLFVRLTGTTLIANSALAPSSSASTERLRVACCTFLNSSSSINNRFARACKIFAAFILCYYLPHSYSI